MARKRASKIRRFRVYRALGRLKKKGALDQVAELTGTRPQRCYVDRGYRGHNVIDTQVFISGQRRNVTPTVKKELKRHSAIEAVIGHEKTEGSLSRNRLRGLLGDKVNALMAALATTCG